MNAYLVFVVAGPMIVLSRLSFDEHPGLQERLSAFGKFIAYEVPMGHVEGEYSAHLPHVLSDPKQTDDFRILDTDSKRIFTNIDFNLLTNPFISDPGG